MNADSHTPTPRAFTRRAAQLLRIGLASLVILLAPRVSLAGSSGTTFTLNSELQQFIDLISGPFGITVGTLAIIACIFGMVFKSQRGEPWGKLGIAVLGVFLILNIESVMDFFFTASGAAM